MKSSIYRACSDSDHSGKIVTTAHCRVILGIFCSYFALFCFEFATRSVPRVACRTGGRNEKLGSSIQQEICEMMAMGKMTRKNGTIIFSGGTAGGHKPVTALEYYNGLVGC